MDIDLSVYFCLYEPIYPSSVICPAWLEYKTAWGYVSKFKDLVKPDLGSGMIFM